MDFGIIVDQGEILPLLWGIGWNFALLFKIRGRLDQFNFGFHIHLFVRYSHQRPSGYEVVP
jgi:hypothetical protein